MDYIIVTIDADKQSDSSSILSVTIAGAIAGLAMATVIYPLDTFKTRWQSGQSFKKAGGYRGLYQGFSTLALGAMPINSMFFGTYEAAKQFWEPRVAPQYLPLVNTISGSICRGMTAIIRVPVEIAKQRQQTGINKGKHALTIWTEAYRKEGIRRGLYRGFASTVLRDMPFSFIQMPIWEMLTSTSRDYTKRRLTGFQSALCGFIAGGVAAAITTPLDVVKTRIMLADASGVSYDKLRIRIMIVKIYMESGIRGLYAGILPRMGMIMIGGFVFFGAYEEVKKFTDDYLYET